MTRPRRPANLPRGASRPKVAEAAAGYGHSQRIRGTRDSSNPTCAGGHVATILTTMPSSPIASHSSRQPEGRGSPIARTRATRDVSAVSHATASHTSWAASPAVRRCMQANRSRDTRPELAVRSALHGAGLRFRVHVRALAGRNGVVDIAFPRQRLAVFIDGCFWHGCPQHGTCPRTNGPWWATKLATNARRDRATTDALEALGWHVIRCWEHEHPADVVARVLAARASINASNGASNSAPSDCSSATE